MKKILILVTLTFGHILYSQNCESLKNQILLESDKQLPVVNVEQLLTSLKECGLDEAEIEIITNQVYFIGKMTELIKKNDSDIRVADYLNSYLEFKKTEQFNLYYDSYKKWINQESIKITDKNISKYENIWKERFGNEQAMSMVEFLTENKFINSGKTYKQGIKEYYLFKFEMNPYEKNLAGVGLRSN